MKAFEFTITVVGAGDNEQEAWEDAKQSALQKVEEDIYDSAEKIGDSCTH